ncbi:hypothetical protein [uncultured Acetobacteroides sp.]|uniref:hypothetical protein n=1 Tax=uncultured Acetobacteroides sp. TaxID=1760811 RepID=UPI0029F4BD86|nr:hypothetical protein [uncultured Acetobacteroides sp.]
MFQQYTAPIGQFGSAYALLEATEKDKKVSIEYYLIFKDGETPYIKGGVLEVETVLDQTMQTYVEEHVAESLPYMVLRYLVDNREPSELENLPEVVFTETADAATTIKASFPDYAKLIAEKTQSEQIRQALK